MSTQYGGLIFRKLQKIPLNYVKIFSVFAPLLASPSREKESKNTNIFCEKRRTPPARLTRGVAIDAQSSHERPAIEAPFGMFGRAVWRLSQLD